MLIPKTKILYTHKRDNSRPKSLIGIDAKILNKLLLAKFNTTLKGENTMNK